MGIGQCGTFGGPDAAAAGVAGWTTTAADAADASVAGWTTRSSVSGSSDSDCQIALSSAKPLASVAGAAVETSSSSSPRSLLHLLASLPLPLPHLLAPCRGAMKQRQRLVTTHGRIWCEKASKGYFKRAQLEKH